jgi:uncharacterized protein YdaU (DUF1376 family)
MKQKPYISFYQQDFLGSLDVQMMDAEEIGCYCLLLFNCYNNGGVLPNNEAKLIALCRGSAKASNVITKFYVKGDFLRHKRIDEELQKRKEFSKKMSDAANRRWSKPKKKVVPTHSQGNADAMHDVQSLSTSPSLSNNPQTPEGGDVGRKAFLKLQKWFKGMSDVSVPHKLAEKYLTLYSAKIILRALKSSTCTSRAKFVQLCDHYKKNGG